MLADTLGTLVTYNPGFVRLDTPLLDAVELLSRELVRNLPVTDDQRQVVGVVSTLSIATANFQTATGGSESSVGGFPEADGASLADFMAQPAVTIEESGTALAAVERMLDHHIHSLPVVREERLVGMLSSSDVLREFSYGDLPEYHMPVRGFLDDGLAQVEMHDSLSGALAMLDELDFEYVAVVQGECPVGILAHRDLDRALAHCPELEQAHGAEVTFRDYELSDLMLTDVPTLLPNDTMGKAATIMLEHRSPALAVVDRRHRLAGVITQDHVLQVVRDALRSQLSA